MKSPSARRPVFLDATGRRHRTIRRAGALLAVPAVGYLILMASSLLGGPRLDTPLIPGPEVAHPANRPAVSPGPAAVESMRPSETAPTPTSTPGETPASTPATTVPSTTPTVVPTPTIAPTTTTPGKPTTAHTTNKPTEPPGRTKSPSKP